MFDWRVVNVDCDFCSLTLVDEFFRELDPRSIEDIRAEIRSLCLTNHNGIIPYIVYVLKLM